MHYVYGHFDVRPISLYRLFKALSVIVAMLAFDKYGKVYCIAIITGFSGHKIPWQKVTANKVQIFKKIHIKKCLTFSLLRDRESRRICVIF